MEISTMQYNQAFIKLTKSKKMNRNFKKIHLALRIEGEATARFCKFGII